MPEQASLVVIPSQVSGKLDSTREGIAGIVTVSSREHDGGGERFLKTELHQCAGLGRPYEVQRLTAPLTTFTHEAQLQQHLHGSRHEPDTSRMSCHRGEAPRKR